MPLHLIEIAPDILDPVATADVILVRKFIQAALTLQSSINPVVQPTFSRIEFTQTGKTLEELTLYELWEQLMEKLAQDTRQFLAEKKTHLWRTMLPIEEGLNGNGKPQIVVGASHRMIYSTIPEMTVAVTALGATAKQLVRIEG